MLHLMIVDDDALMGNQLAAMLDWREAGVEIACFASDGQEAIAALTAQNIDAVLTDMDMPGIDGVQLIEYISIHHPDIYVVALSAYDDYHYVRGSMKFGAHDYLLKNKLSAEVLKAMLGELKNKVRLADDWKSHGELTREQLIDSFFRRVLQGSEFDRVQIGHLAKNLQINFNRECLAVMIADGTFEEDPVLKRSVYHMVRQILKEADFVRALELEAGGFCFVISFQPEPSQAEMLRKLEQWGRTVTNGGQKFFNAVVTVSISEICRDISQLHQYYRRADDSRDSFFYDDRRQLILGWTGAVTGPAVDRTVSFPEIRELKQYLREGRQQELTAQWDSFFEEVRRLKPWPAAFIAAAVPAFERILLYGEELGAGREFLLGAGGDSLEELKRSRRLSSVRELFLSVINRLCMAVGPEYEDNHYHRHTRSALRIVRTRYTEALTLNDVAMELKVSSAYISSIFKQDIGTGFNEYLNNLRIERVIGQLKNGNGTLKEIVSSSGFQNYNYFFKVFKEHTGMTPTQYFHKQ